MRISDWSSDVCSSDLAFIGKGDIGKGCLAGIELASGCTARFRLIRQLGIGAVDRLHQSPDAPDPEGDVESAEQLPLGLRQAVSVGASLKRVRSASIQGAF